MKNYLKTLAVFFVAVLGLALVAFDMSRTASAATTYSAGSLLQIGDVLSKHILNGTILDIDISTSSNILVQKIRTGGQQGSVFFSDGTKFGSSTNFRYSSSTNEMSIIGGRISATSTSFNGVNYAWPSADGSSAQALKTDGAGTLSWGSVTASSLASTFTTDFQLKANDVVALASSTINQDDTTQPGTATSIPFGNTTGTGEEAFMISYPTGVVVATTTFTLSKFGSPADNIIFRIRGAAAGSPDTAEYASTTLPGSTFTTSMASYTVTWNRPVFFVGSTTISYTMDRTGAVDGSNYYLWGDALGGGTRGSFKQLTAPSTWTAYGNFYMGGTYSTHKVTVGNVIPASGAQYFSSGTVFGINQASAATGTQATVTFAGLASGLSGLAPSAPYYVCNSSATLCSLPSATSAKVGGAITSTTLKISGTPF